MGQFFPKTSAYWSWITCQLIAKHATCHVTNLHIAYSQPGHHGLCAARSWIIRENAGALLKAIIHLHFERYDGTTQHCVEVKQIVLLVDYLLSWQRSEHNCFCRRFSTHCRVSQQDHIPTGGNWQVQPLRTHTSSNQPLVSLHPAPHQCDERQQRRGL